MTIGSMLTESRDEILDEAYAVVEHSHVTHYEKAGEEFTRHALGALFDEVLETIRSRDLGPLQTHVEGLATERFEHGFDVSEVQLAINSLELAMWRRIVASAPPAELIEDIGLLSTSLGAAKDVLARTYVSLATKRHVASLDLSALFRGTS